ncbi:MAG: aminotransferase class V-fold PLP-dependent enzyme [Bryobacteraceae bacterium]
MSVDWQSLRAEFPALSGWTCLNTATFGQMPRRAVEAVNRHFARRDRAACMDFMQWFDDADSIRALAARLVHCRPEDIAFIQNASSGFSLLLGGIDWKPGDRIVTFHNEFPNHYYHPSWLRRIGVEFVDADYGNFRQAVTERTRLVAVSTVNYTDGFRAPLQELAPWLHERGGLLYVDGTQSVGALEFDIGRVQPDLLAVHAYKWLLSPNGAGFMYVSPRLRGWLPPNVIGWRSDRRWRNFENLHHGEPEFSPDAERYEGGMVSFALLYAMAAAIEMELEIGPAAIERRVMELAQGAREVLRNAGAELPSGRLPHYDSQIVAAAFPGADARALARGLQERRVLVSARHGNLRVSPHFYNDDSDLDRLAAALAELGFTPRRTCFRTPPASCPPGE